MIIDRRAYADMVPDDWIGLTADEERDLIGRVRDGDEDAREVLVIRNIPLVLNLSAAHHMYRLMPDLIGAGILGLVEATYDYDPDRGRYSTHASWRIRMRQQEAICGTLHPVTMPPHANTIYTRLSRAARTCREDGIDYTPDNVAEMIGKSRRSTGAYMRLHPRGGVSIDEIPETAATVDDRPRRYERVVDIPLHELLAHVDDLDREILAMRFGLDGRPAMRYSEIGEHVGLSHQKVYPRCMAALAAIRKAIETEQDI